METLVKEEDIEICKSCNAEANPKNRVMIGFVPSVVEMKILLNTL